MAIEAISHVAQLAGQEVYGEEGELLIGGHTLRVTGAQTLAAKGINILTIKALARHSSDVILRYVASAPIQSLTGEYKRRMAELDVEQRITLLREEMLNFHSSLGSVPHLWRMRLTMIGDY